MVNFLLSLLPTYFAILFVQFAAEKGNILYRIYKPVFYRFALLQRERSRLIRARNTLAISFENSRDFLPSKVHKGFEKKHIKANESYRKLIQRANKKLNNYTFFYKPVIGCAYCMASIYGSVVFFMLQATGTIDSSIYLLPLYCVSVSGLTIFINQIHG